MNQGDSDTIFKMDKSFNGIIIFGLLFFGAGLIISLILPFFFPALISIWFIWLPVIIGYILFFKMCYGVWKGRNNYVTLNDEEICLHSQEKQIARIRWNEIVAVKENNISERLILINRSNDVLKLEYQLENINELLNIVSERIPHLKQQYSHLKKFRRTKHLHLFFGIPFILVSSLVAYSWYSKELFATFALGGFSCLLIYVLLMEYTGVHILDDRISISYPLWRKKIKFSQIKNISLENIRGGNGKSSIFVVLQIENNKEVKLNALREGTIALFSALSSKLSTKPS